MLEGAANDGRHCEWWKVPRMVEGAARKMWGTHHKETWALRGRGGRRREKTVGGTRVSKEDGREGIAKDHLR